MAQPDYEKLLNGNVKDDHQELKKQMWASEALCCTLGSGRSKNSLRVVVFKINRMYAALSWNLYKCTAKNEK